MPPAQASGAQASHRPSGDSLSGSSSLRHARPAPARAGGTFGNNRAIVIGLIVGAVLSALLVIGLWLWLMVKRG